MAHPYHHAVSSSRKWGGVPEDYQPIHDWFDESKAFQPDIRHRALRHHAEGIFMAEQIFGTTIELSCNCGSEDRVHRDSPRCSIGKKIPTRWVGEQHVNEDLGWVPTASDWLRNLEVEGWMMRGRKLSNELEKEDESARNDNLNGVVS